MGYSKILRSRSSGFTLVELIIVIVVVAILATLTIIAYNGIRNRALDAGMQSDADTAYKLMANFYTINNYYDFNSLANGKLKVSGQNVYSTTVSGTFPTAIYSVLVTNPNSNDSYAISIGGASNTNVPILQTNPYITNPLIGATTDTGWCGPAPQTMSINSTGGGNPTPTYQWQIMLPKNSTSGTWSNISGQTTFSLNYTLAGMNYGDYVLVRVQYTSNGNTVTSASDQINATNGC